MNDDAFDSAEPPSLRDEISAAMLADAPDAPAAAAEAPPPAEAGPTRDEQGKFAKAPEPGPAASDPPARPPEGADEPPKPETIAPPAAWSAAAKARFAVLDPVIQREVLKREKDMDAGKAQWDQKGERLNRLDAVLSPRRERIQLAGLDEVRAIEALFAAQDFLERDPASGLSFLARQYGVDLGRLAPGHQGQAAEPPMHPMVQRLAEQVNALQSALAQQQSSAREAQAQHQQAQLLAFRADPANLYFDNVQADMTALLRSGRASDLKDAYDKAVWANPETRTLMLSAAEDQRRAEAADAARAKTQAARHASGSITGSPQPGSSPANAGPAPTLRDELARAFSEAS